YWAKWSTPGRSTRSGASATRMGPCLTKKRTGQNWPARDAPQTIERVAQQGRCKCADRIAQRYPFRVAPRKVLRHVFYFQAPRAGEGRRHFWRYIDASTHEIKENRFEIAQLICCLPDEPRYIGNQDVFMLQDKVIEHILAADREAEAKAAA